MFWLIPSAHANTFMPPAATAVAAKVDSLYAFMLITSLISFVGLVGAMMYFVYKYKRKGADDKTPYITHNHFLEFVWSFIPFVIFMVCFAWGAYVYMEMRTFEENSLEINVTGKKWVWEFDYKNGTKAVATVNAEGGVEPPTLIVPIDKPVKLLMTSAKVTPEDKAVLHSFFVPAFRIKQDVIPGRYTALTFTANKLGLFQVFCTEFCGTGHSMMLAKVKVVTQEEFDAWVVGDVVAGAVKGDPLIEKGIQVFQAKACIGCHSLDGKAVLAGPTWKGLYGSTRKFMDGSTAVADENYIRESIMEPNKHIVVGFKGGQMPTFKGNIEEDEILAIIELIKSKK